LLGLEPVPALLGRLAGCPDPTPALRWRTQAGHREARPCGPPGRAIYAHFAGPRWAMSIGNLPPAFRGEPPRETIASSADAKRAIDALSEQLRAAVAVDPEATLATLGAMAGRTSFSRSVPRPTVVGVTHTQGALHLQMELPPGGLDAWARMAWTLKSSMNDDSAANPLEAPRDLTAPSAAPEEDVD
jgi:hypothetical protein